MTTLHIEHPIVDFGLWNTAFERFADARGTAGVRGQRVSRPVNDDHYVIIDLTFDDATAAERFLVFLRTHIWTSAERSPALAGEPLALIFEARDSRTTVSAGTTRR
jgi:hypothetical protein